MYCRPVTDGHSNITHRPHKTKHAKNNPFTWHPICSERNRFIKNINRNIKQNWRYYTTLAHTTGDHGYLRQCNTPPNSNNEFTIPIIIMSKSHHRGLLVDWDRMRPFWLYSVHWVEARHRVLLVSVLELFSQARETIFLNSTNREREPDNMPADLLKVHLSLHACYRSINCLCLIRRCGPHASAWCSVHLAITKEVGRLGGLNAGSFSRPIEQRWSITVHNSISADINCAFSYYLTHTQLKSDTVNKRLHGPQPRL